MKLLQIQLKYFDKNWRQENLYIISHIYQLIDTKNEENQPIENWLKYEKKDQRNPDILTLDVANIFILIGVKKNTCRISFLELS